MIQICPKCAYARTPTDTGPDDVCPACGVIFSKYLANTAARDAARVSTRRRAEPKPRSTSTIVKVLVVVLIVAGLTNRYYSHRYPASNFKHVSVPVVADSDGGTDQREFADLFNNDRSLASLAKLGSYTVVEVYLDQCTYCRELEAALTPFQDKRKDVRVIRVHHPGQMSSSVTATSREEMEAKMKVMNERMSNYQLCGSPHVEVYGPDKKPLGVDTCKDRAGTAFLWNWMTSETGIARRSAVGAVSQMF